MNLLEYKEKLISLAKCYGDIEVEFVPNIKNWCNEHGVKETNKNRIGKCLQISDTKRHLILLKQEIDNSQMEEIKFLMQEHGSTETQLSLIYSPKEFAFHLLLHECAHALHESFGESECDNWAFNELSKTKI